jgi:hypothetical protein
VETDEKDRVEEDAKTKQKAEYVPTTITCDPILKTKIPNKFAEETDEKDQVEEADKTEQNAEYVLTAITCVPLLKIKTPNKFDEVSIDRDKTEEFDVELQNAVHTALTALKYIENNHTAFKKISVQVDTERAESEVQNYVESQNAGSAALAALKTAKTDELDAKDKFEELNVLKQNADDADPELQHLHRHPEQARRAK